MESPTERAALVALLRSGSRPWQLYAELVEEAGSALSVLEAESQHAGGQATLFVPDRAALLNQATAEIDGWEADGLKLVTVLDRGYPENLRAVHDRPPLIFVAGRLDPTDARAIAVIGSRTASEAGIEAASATATSLVADGFTIASGLASGIDAAAHTAALGAGGRTIAVIGTGINRSYPPENAALQRQIAERAAVVSQFWPDAPPSRRSFPMRNAVMSGLSLATVVIEATQTSGARMQARLALAHGRPVFLLAALVDAEPWAREFAARPGAYVVDDRHQIATTVDRLTSAGALVA